jgi:hypothetical protein
VLKVLVGDIPDARSGWGRPAFIPWDIRLSAGSSN